MRNKTLIGLALLFGVAANPVTAQRLDQPGSIPEGGEAKAISPQSVAVRCEREQYRMKAQVECSRSDAYQAEQARRRSHRK